MDKNTIYSRFRLWADRQPEAQAIVEDGRAVSYRELDTLADAIMSRFYKEDYQAIGVVMSQGIEMIAAMLAVLKSGAAYVPAEPSLPKSRIDYMTQTAGVSLVITDEQGLAYLTAYFVPSHKNCRLSRIKRFMRERLADFMIPEFFVRMEEIPLTRRGKVNDRALPVIMKVGEPELMEEKQ